MASVTLYPGDDVAAAVEAHPAGTVFLLRPGLYIAQEVFVSKNGLEFRATDSGVRWDGRGKAHAIRGQAGTQAGDQCLIDGIEAFGYKPERQEAVIQGLGEAWFWTVINCDIHDNSNIGIKASAGWSVSRCHVHHQGTLGVGGAGSDILFADCEIDNNNVDRVDPGWEGGGSKWVWSDGLKVLDCYVHDNYGPGLWTDGNIQNIEFAHNRVSNNFGPGIFAEISRDVKIRNNDVRFNGFGYTGWIDGAGILIGDTTNAEVYDNIVLWNNDGIAGKHTGRGSGAYGEYALKNLYVHGNVVGMARGQTGMVWSAGTPDDPSWNNRFENNTYILRGVEPHFRWGADLHDFENWRVRHELTALLAKPPSRPRKPYWSGESHLLKWLPPLFDNGLPVYDYRIERDGVVVRDGVRDGCYLSSDVPGTYRVAAVNLAGRGAWSAQVVVE